MQTVKSRKESFIMANLKIKATEAIRNSVSFVEAENKRKAEIFEQELQKTLDQISEFILEASSNGRFSVEIQFKLENDCDDDFDGIVIYNKDVAGTAVQTLREGGYRSHIENYSKVQTIKVFWDNDDVSDDDNDETK
jgi:hypothetical protein